MVLLLAFWPIHQYTEHRCSAAAGFRSLVRASLNHRTPTNRSLSKSLCPISRAQRSVCASSPCSRTTNYFFAPLQVSGTDDASRGSVYKSCSRFHIPVPLNRDRATKRRTHNSALHRVTSCKYRSLPLLLRSRDQRSRVEQQTGRGILAARELEEGAALAERKRKRTQAETGDGPNKAVFNNHRTPLASCCRLSSRSD